MNSETDYGLTFVIYPDGESVSIALFLKAIEHINRIIQDVDYAATKEKGVRRWVIAGLHSSYPTITVRPPVDGHDLVKTVVNGLRTIEQGATEPPAYFTEQTRDHLKKMRRLFVGKDRARRVVVSSNSSESVALQDDIGEKADRILKGGCSNLGSVEGVLDAVNLHGKPTFTIWDRVSRAPVRCGFPRGSAWKERVKNLLEKTVLVVGRVNYFRNGIPRSIADIRDIQEMTRAAYLPKAAFGSIPTSAVDESPAMANPDYRNDRRGPLEAR